MTYLNSLLPVQTPRDTSRQAPEPVEGDADWEGFDPHQPPAPPHPEWRIVGFRLHSGQQSAAAALNKVDAVVLGVEADQVAGQDALQDLAVPG